MIDEFNICSKNNIKLKASFLGPKSENSFWLEENINKIFSHWCEWRRNRFPLDGVSITKKNLEENELKILQNCIFKLQSDLSTRFELEVPKYSPRYMGHMVSEISLPALFGHIVGLLHNPNNSSLSASKVGSVIENEAIRELSDMIGHGGQGTGHFTSGGTVANIEALWRARFRLDNSLALGSYLRDKSLSQRSLFESAHLGVEESKSLLNKYKLKYSETKKYSYVVMGPYHAANIYQNIYKEKFKGAILLVPAHKHYSWQKGISLMGMGDEALWSVKINKDGRLCIDDLRRKIERARKENRPILAVVSVSGTTEIGMVDPIDDVQDLLDEYKKMSVHIWHHVDGAYGGIYTSMLRGDGELSFRLGPKIQKSLNALARAESVTLDPHKLAMVPYSCGAILVKDESAYHVSQFDAPYLKESKENTGRWNSTLEGSRASTGACATWMVAKSLGMNKKGLGELLALGIGAKLRLRKILEKMHPQIKVLPQTDTNILCFTFATESQKISDSNILISSLYKEIIKNDEFSVSQTSLKSKSYKDYIESICHTWRIQNDSDEVFLIRMVLMNPFSISKENNFDYLYEFSLYLQRLLLTNV